MYTPDDLKTMAKEMNVRLSSFANLKTVEDEILHRKRVAYCEELKKQKQVQSAALAAVDLAKIKAKAVEMGLPLTNTVNFTKAETAARADALQRLQTSKQESKQDSVMIRASKLKECGFHFAKDSGSFDEAFEQLKIKYPWLASELYQLSPVEMRLYLEFLGI